MIDAANTARARSHHTPVVGECEVFDKREALPQRRSILFYDRNIIAPHRRSSSSPSLNGSFTDPFTDMDTTRRAAAIQAIGTFAENHQILFLTCHPDHAGELQSLAGAKSLSVQQ